MEKICAKCKKEESASLLFPVIECGKIYNLCYACYKAVIRFSLGSYVINEDDLLSDQELHIWTFEENNGHTDKTMSTMNLYSETSLCNQLFAKHCNIYTTPSTRDALIQMVYLSESCCSECLSRFTEIVDNNKIGKDYG